MLIGGDELAQLIPHSGAMCLLAGVRSWDQEKIICESHSHRDNANPLRRAGRLSALHGCEYAAQAMAVHGALLAREQGQELPPGFLAALRDVCLHAEYLDDITSPLRISAQRLLAAGGNLIYQFEVQAAAQTVLTGRATVMVPGNQEK